MTVRFGAQSPHPQFREPLSSCRLTSPARWTPSTASTSAAIPLLPCCSRPSGAGIRCSTIRRRTSRCTRAGCWRTAPRSPSRTRPARHYKLVRPAHRRCQRPRCGPAAPGPSLRHVLHHHHAPAGAHPSQDAGRQRPRERAQRAGKSVRARFPRPDAADAGHPQRRGRDASGPSTRTSSSSRSMATAALRCSTCRRATPISTR